MDEQRMADEFERIELRHAIERARTLLTQYHEHQAYWHKDIEEKLYRLGILDERLGGQHDNRH